MKNKFTKGDKVFVIDWGKVYSKIPSGNGVFWDDLPRYSSTDDFIKIIYNKISPATGKPYKNSTYWTVKERIPEYKDFKYEVVDFKPHPKAGELYWTDSDGKDHYYSTTPIYLIKSKEGCYVEIGEGGLSHLTLKQYKNKEFNALKHYHKGRWTVDMMEEERSRRFNSKTKSEFPEELLKVIYDKDDNVLFGSGMTKGKVTYTYIPAEFTTDNVDFIIGVSCLYDGKGNEDVKDAEFLSFNELKSRFTNNEFSNN